MWVRELIEWIGLTIELLGVMVIVASIIVALVPNGLLRLREPADALTGYKRRMGRGLLLGLELLLAADIIETVGTELTVQMLLPLGLLVLIRCFLSWSLEVEIDGRWPWQARAEKLDTRSEPARVKPVLSSER